MFSWWAVTGHTFKQSLRMKVAVLFMLLLAVAIISLPLSMKGDGTLAGRIRTFLAYGPGLTGVLLSLMTIFLTTGIVADDVRNKQIFNVVTKPVSRWEYIIGRWLGVVLLDVLLIVIATVAIYFMSQYLRSQEALNPEDRRAVETDIFTARRSVSPDPLNINQAVAARIRQLQERGLIQGALESYRTLAGGDEKLARQKLTEEIHKQVSKQMQSVAPKLSMVWEFKGIDVKKKQSTGVGTVTRVDLKDGIVAIKAQPSILGKLIYKAPVRINGLDGQVWALGDDIFAVRFNIEQMSGAESAMIRPGKSVEIVADSTIQLTYKATPSTVIPGDPFASYWQILNPQTGLQFSAFLNDQGSSLQDDISVQYAVDNFESNFVRGMLLIMVQLAFLSALGILTGSLLSFPVACLVCFSMLPFQVGREFLLESVKITRTADGIGRYFSHYVVKVMNLLLPDFSKTSPTESFVDGLNITWSYLGEIYFWTLFVQTLFLLVVACIFFRRRELARVQV